jgi:phenylacetate-CoA ligase
MGTPLAELLEPRAAPADAALAHFHDVAAGVPAYATFLRTQGCDPAAVRTIEDFVRVPLVTKDNYLRRFPLPQLCRNGRLEDCDIVAVSSGSTGEPTFWPRFVTDELAIATRFEQVFRDAFAAAERRTLAVVCFALGSWVGGMYSSACCRHLAAKGYPITVVTPGNQREEIYRVVRALAPHFEQTVLLGYPPFLKDVLDGGRDAGIDWRSVHVKLVMAGEVFSEDWRSLVAERAGSDDPCHDTASLYGTADAGVLGNETPLSICIRRHLAARPETARELFGQARLPTLVQYDPCSRYFETIAGDDGTTLLFSGDNGVPLVRYHIADQGGIIGFDAMLEFLAVRGLRSARHARGDTAAPPSLRVRLRSRAFRRLLLRRKRLPGERERRARAAGRARLGDGQVRAAGARRHRAGAAPRDRSRAGCGSRARRGEARSDRALDPDPHAAAQQRVRELRAGRVPHAAGHAA